MAESKLTETAGEIKAILEAVHRDGDATKPPDTPHVELIDFDRMMQVLRNAQEFLEAESHAATELERVKSWMRANLEARLKALSFLKNKIPGRIEAEDLKQLPVDELIRKYEESGRALSRSVKGTTAQIGILNSDAGKYSNFKS